MLRQPSLINPARKDYGLPHQASRYRPRRARPEHLVRARHGLVGQREYCRPARRGAANVRFCRDEVRRHERGEGRSASPPGWLTITWGAAGTPAVDAAAHPSPITIAERSRPLPWRTREEPPDLRGRWIRDGDSGKRQI